MVLNDLLEILFGGCIIYLKTDDCKTLGRYTVLQLKQNKIYLNNRVTFVTPVNYDVLYISIII